MGTPRTVVSSAAVRMNSLTGVVHRIISCDRGWHQVHVLAQSFQLTGGFNQGEQPTGDGVLGGVVAGAGDDHVVRRGVDIR